MAKKGKVLRPVIGWREWIELPDLGVKSIKAKIDTGARSSSLHAFDIKIYRQGEDQWARFQINPVQHKTGHPVTVDARILEFRSIRSSNGVSMMRPVIVTNIAFLGATWPIELTLSNRDEMGFRMLLGREAVRGRFLVDAGSSFLGGKPPRDKHTNTNLG
ncbi:hypothetical protein DSLASN_22970 [Desulfoluna limicola]|uniref:Retropepsin-like aspartic endopeptidase domain-containing protein n=1 Tax=Desulfoluna limicola TaxID=2810562 RepID=A0ABM7PH38_9BACT|nr:RimK/LysX family protein [Desulfoluna limicola]BCS96665.1 hypothetical protein DSLASN_22970 [Desulfoluna limicola]